MDTVTRIHHDPFCPACGATGCTYCDCLCDLLTDVRDDERRSLTAPSLGHEIAAENRP